MDREVIGEHFHVFDLLSREGTDLCGRSCDDRYRALKDLIDSAASSAHIGYVASWTDSLDKAERGATRQPDRLHLKHRARPRASAGRSVGALTFILRRPSERDLKQRQELAVRWVAANRTALIISGSGSCPIGRVDAGCRRRRFRALN